MYVLLEGERRYIRLIIPGIDDMSAEDDRQEREAEQREEERWNEEHPVIMPFSN